MIDLRRPRLPSNAARSLATLVALAAVLSCRGASDAPALHRAQAPPPDTAFVGLVERLSESGAYFDTDNLISNERSYLHVIDALEERSLAGGAYVGVGPDQNFSYIAAIRPEIAFIIDIRRDNLLQHLFFKALFVEAPTRLEYLALLLGREPPAGPETSADRSADELVALFDDPHQAATELDPAIQRRVRDRIERFGFDLSLEDMAFIESVHRRFAEAGLDLRFTSHGRGPMPYYPTLRDLLLERSRDGRQTSYLASEDRYAVVRRLQLEHRIVPVVGDLAGAHALPAISAEVARRNLEVTAIYTSNVEFYLMRDGAFDRFAESVAAMPVAPEGVMIRSYFNRWRGGHPLNVPGYGSTQLLQSLPEFAAAVRRGERFSYSDLVYEGYLEPTVD